MAARLRIGTRGSPLALAQADEVRSRLAAAHPALAAPEAVAVVVIRTSGDRIQDRTLAEAGGKGLFTKEIDEALLAGGIDLAVHSMKDVPTWLPPGLAITCLLPREDPRDALFTAPGLADELDALPAGAVLGTASLRRQAQVLARRPDLHVVTLRGNVETRLRKLADGAVHATLLAVAGLRRLGLAAQVTRPLSPDEMMPAIGQGAIGVACRDDDAATRRWLAALNCPRTELCVAAERALLAALDGSCRTPIAGLAVVADEGDLVFDALVARPDGTVVHRASRRGATAEAAALGNDAGVELRARMGPGFFT